MKGPGWGMLDSWVDGWNVGWLLSSWIKVGGIDEEEVRGPFHTSSVMWLSCCLNLNAYAIEIN